MSKKVVRLVFSAVLFALCLPAQAQQPAKIPRIGYLGVASYRANAARVKAFQQGLRELGYVEGKNIVVEWRHAEGKIDRLRELAAELVRLKLDIIVSGGTVVTRVAKDATSTIPIVMTNDNDPVGSGFVNSLARPGGNITGLSTFGPELSGKRLELLKEVVPKLSRVAVLWSSSNPDNALSLREVDLVAKAFGVTLQYLDVLGPKDIKTAFRTASKGRADALLIVASGVTVDHRTEIANLAIKSRLPAIYHRSEFVEDGGLMIYGVSLNDLSRAPRRMWTRF